jgi:hypothetical protein
VVRPSRPDVVAALIHRHGRTFASEAGIRLDGGPGSLFQLLCLSTLLSARIRAAAAIAAQRGLVDAGWVTPAAMAASTWSERTRVLNESGYARYDERTSRMLADSAALVLSRYDGDLAGLRDEAEHDPRREHELLQRFSGIGPVGASIFCREAQQAWDELFPFADDRALASASLLGLGDDVDDLVQLSGTPGDFVVLVAALVRCDLAHDHDDVLKAARSRC